MDNLYARAVFFAKDAERSLEFYTKTLGFTLEWKFDYEGRANVFEVGLFGFQLILNQTWPDTAQRAGHGRVFIGLEDDQWEPVRQHIEEKGIKTSVDDWGEPTLVIHDLDQNEIFFWVPPSERPALRARLAASAD